MTNDTTVPARRVPGLSLFLPEFVFGGIDGLVTTFSVVAGAAGAHLPVSTIIILGFANLLADGFSMSIGNYLAAKAEVDQYRKAWREEEDSIRKKPLQEKEEVRHIFAARGLKGSLLTRMVQAVTGNHDLWLQMMMEEEYHLTLRQKSAWESAVVTFIAFNVVGFIPLSVYIFAQSNLFLWSCVATGVGFLLVGFLKGKVNNRPILREILITLALGTAAASVAYVVGVLLDRVF